MGWGTEFTTSLYLNKLVFVSEGDLDDVIKDLEEDLETTKVRLVYFLGISKKKYKKKGESLLNDYLEILEWRDDTVNRLKLLYIYKEYVEEIGWDNLKPQEDE